MIIKVVCFIKLSEIIINRLNIEISMSITQSIAKFNQLLAHPKNYENQDRLFFEELILLSEKQFQWNGILIIQINSQL